ncbi:MAG: hypothetical protein F6K19_28740 [Cyanothece sp. SIO1E1]|nr:hypothetical protein [Cyanothece sp. SIO1E1]
MLQLMVVCPILAVASQGVSLIGPNLRYADWQGVDLTGIDLQSAELASQFL